jgi:hypothetical protein
MSAANSTKGQWFEAELFEFCDLTGLPTTHHFTCLAAGHHHAN